MSETIVKEWYFLIVSVIAGIGMAFTYDLIRLFRSLVHHNSLFINIEDMLYWIACFFAAFTLLYYGNNGVIRFAAVLGAAVGMAVYAVSLGKIFVKYVSLCIKKIIFWLSKPILYVLLKIKKSIYAIFLLLKKHFNLKYRLTRLVINNKINIRYASEKKPVSKYVKEESVIYEKKKKKKNSGISPSEK